MSLVLKACFGTAILFAMVPQSETIYCYYCNSANNSACLDVNQYEEELRARIIPVVHCESAIPSPFGGDFFCRKIIQTIYHSKHDSEVRVTRGCGWIKYHKDCYKADNADHLETVCQCFSDNCNSGNFLRGSMMMVLASLSGYLVLKV